LLQRRNPVTRINAVRIRDGFPRRLGRIIVGMNDRQPPAVQPEGRIVAFDQREFVPGAATAANVCSNVERCEYRTPVGLPVVPDV